MQRNQILIAKVLITQGKLGLKMIQMNSHTKQRETHRQRKQTYGYQRGRQEGINQEFGINRYTLLHIK